MTIIVSRSIFLDDPDSYLRRVNEDADALLITGTEPDDEVVVMSRDEYESLTETMRVYGNPYLRDKIIRGLHQVRAE